MIRIQERIAVAEGRVEEQAMRIDDVREALGSLEARMDRRFDGVERRFDLIDQRFVLIEQRFTTIDNRFMWMAGVMVAGFVAVVGVVLQH